MYPTKKLKLYFKKRDTLEARERHRFKPARPPIFPNTSPLMGESPDNTQGCPRRRALNQA